MAERKVQCPRCGLSVQVPVTGEKVRCPGCRQKFRFDVPALSPPHLGADAAWPPLVSPAQAQVPLPLSPLPSLPPLEPRPAPLPLALPPLPRPPLTPEALAPAAPAPPPFAPPPLAPVPPGAAPLTNEILCPRCGRPVQVPLTGEKVRCPGCGQKFRYDRSAIRSAADDDLTPLPGSLASPGAPPLLPPAPSPADADELRFLWPSLCQFVARRYEEGRADDGDRLRFRTQADRAAALARQLLPAGTSAGGDVITTVLPETTLDEILRLSLEDFRHLQEGLDEAQALINRLPSAAPVLIAPPASAAPAAGRPPRRSPSSLPVFVGVAALFVAAAAAIVAIPAFRERGRKAPERERSWAETIGVAPATSLPAPEPGRPKPSPPEPKVSSRLAVAPVPAIEPPKSATPVTPTPEPAAPKAEPTPATPPPPTPEPPKRVLSRWRPGPDGWIDLFNGKDLDGLQGEPEVWSVKESLLYGAATDSAAPLAAQDAPWTDYTLALDVKLGKQGSLGIGHGALVAFFADSRARLGYPAGSARVLDEASKGLARNQWYHIEFDVKGPRAEVRVNGQLALSTGGHTPQPGAPSLEVHNGALALRSFRLRLHDSDPDYRPVALGEGYLVATKPTPTPTPQAPETPKAAPPLSPGDHALFNHTDLENWTKVGSWTVSDRTIVGRAPIGDHAVLATGSPDWQDYALRARCRFTRREGAVREGEYFLLIVRYQDPSSFYCVRIAIEGIFEVGYYRSGRFHEIQHARAGLGTWFNRWHDVQVTVRGDQLTLAIDGNAFPPSTLRGLDRGSVALGVTGAEAAFSDVRLRLTR